MKRKGKGKGFTVYTIVTTIAEEVAIAAVVLWGLPLLGINIPWWGLALMMIAWAAYSYITYWLCMRALHRKAMVGLEALIGAEGKATCQIAPKGYVRVQGELWIAVSKDTHIDAGEEIVVVGMDKRILLVTTLREENENR